MSENFKQAHDQIEKETKTLQKLTEKWINDIEQMKIRKEKLQARTQQNEVELIVNKSNVKDQEKNISTLNKQISDLKEMRAQANRKAEEEEESADVKSAVGLGLAFVPVVNLIATPFLLVGAKSSREVADELLKQGSKLTVHRNAVEDEMIKVSEVTEDMSKKVESNKRAIKGSKKKQDKLQRKLAEMQTKQRDLISKKKLVEGIMTQVHRISQEISFCSHQAGINIGGARSMEGACSRSLSLGQMLDPIRELLREVSQTHCVARKLEELTNESKLAELEVIWMKVTEEREVLEFQSTADWM